MRHRRLAVLAAAIVLLLSACGSGKGSGTDDNATQVVPGGAVVDLQAFAAGEPDHIDPALASATPEQQIARLVYEGLTVTDEAGAVQYAIASSATPSDAAKTWTFSLRPEAIWDNGQPVEPSDFKFAWERVLDPATGSRLTGQFSLIKGASDVIDGKTKTLSGVVANDEANTLTVSLNDSYYDFPAAVSTTAYLPVPAKVFQADASVSGKWEQGVMIGNGPFKMAGPWEHDKSIKLMKSPTYYGTKSNIDSVEFRVSKDLDAQWSDFLTQKTAVGRVPPGQYQRAANNYGTDLLSKPLLSVEYWGFNLNDPSVGGPENLKLRQAISLAVDKRDIVSKLYGNGRTAASGWAPPNVPGYQVTLTDGSRRTEAAKDLLKEWGKTPPPVKISFNAGAGHEEKAAIMVQNLKDIGITASADPIAQADYNKAVGQGKLQFFRGGWNADFPSYDNLIAPLFVSPPIGDSNVFGYSNASLDALVKTARSTADEAQRNSLYVQAEQMMLKDQVVLPLDWPSSGMVHTSALQNVQVTPLGFVSYQKASVAK